MPYHIETRKYAFTIERMKRLRPEPHIHSDLEIIYLTRGKSLASLDNKEHLIEAGDFFIAFPNQIHYYHDKEPIEGYMIIFTPELFKELKELFKTKVPESPVLNEEKLPADIVNTMEKIYQKRKTDSNYDEIVARGYFLALMGEIIPAMSLKDNEREQDAIKRVLTYCIENFKEPLTLEVLEKELYLNKYYISHIFKERMNSSYKDFINKLRVEYACTMLGKGTSVTDVAYASGFASVRTFNRAFLKYVDMTPRDYMNMQDYKTV